MSEAARELERIAFRIAYLGTAGKGWQSQADGSGIQDAVERSLSELVGSPVRVHGAGRTDTGVHALGQVAHAEVPKKYPRREDFWIRAINARLNPAIRVWQVWWPPADFHARYSAIGKRYRYTINPSPVELPFMHGRAWHLSHAPDLEEMQKVLELFVGKKDFRSFCAGDISQEQSTVRNVFRAEAWQEKGLIYLEFEAEGFLQRMVRLMVGMAVRVGLGKSTRELVEQLLQEPCKGAARFAAPAWGLCLREVFYLEPFQPPSQPFLDSKLYYWI